MHIAKQAPSIQTFHEINMKNTWFYPLNESLVDFSSKKQRIEVEERVMSSPISIPLVHGRCVPTCTTCKPACWISSASLVNEMLIRAQLQWRGGGESNRGGSESVCSQSHSSLLLLCSHQLCLSHCRSTSFIRDWMWGCYFKCLFFTISSFVGN